MLTKNEKNWLKARTRWLNKTDSWGNHPFSIWCRDCNCSSYKHDGAAPYCQEAEDAMVYDMPFTGCLVPSAKLLLDAAEFEARVAAKLASYVETFGWKDCGKELLRQARLAVEEEMDGN